MKLKLIFSAILMLVFFQNCSSGFKALSTGSSAGKNSLLSLGLAFQSPAGLNDFSKSSLVSCAASPSSDPLATADHLQSCIDRTAEGGTVELAATTYRIQKPLFVKKSILIRTAGVSRDAAACLENTDKRCAVIQGVSPLQGVVYGLVQVTASRVAMDHLVVDGNSAERSNGAEAQACMNATSNGLGMNITVTGGSGHVFYRMSSLNAVCGSALAFAGTTPYLDLVENYIARAGFHGNGSWADGLTVTEAPNSRFVGNHVFDATDVDIIFGGCVNCQITSNRVTHSDSFAHSSFAAFMIYSWDGFSGDYSGAQVTDNVIDCGNYRCGFGFLIGAVAWNQGLVKGGRYWNNSVNGAQIGFSVNDATDPKTPVTIGANLVTNSGGRFFARQGPRNMPAFFISPKSRSAVVLENGSLNDWPSDDFVNDIPNWHTQDWVGVAGLGGTTAPAPQTVTVRAPTSVVAPEIPSAQITSLFNQYLPGCWTATKQTFWEQWFGRGGLMSDFVITLKNEALNKPSCMTPVATTTPVTNATSACPANASSLAIGTQLVCSCSASASSSGSLWGSLIYTADSSICRAAVHATVISTNGGNVTLKVLEGLSSYASSVSNAITSSSYGSYSKSFSLVGGSLVAPSTNPDPAVGNYQNQMTRIQLDVMNNFNIYLPGCWTPEKQTYWESWFTRGGTLADYIWTLQSVAATNPSCLRR